MSADGSFDVLIAGAGVGGLEAALALRDLAGEQVAVRLMAPTQEFVYRPMTVREPFSFSRARRYPLRQIADDLGVKLIDDALEGVDASGRVAQSRSGSEFGYDALVLALGASIHSRYERATTIDDGQLDELLRGLIQDVEAGYVKRLAFVVPAPMAWPLPVYELALMTAERAYDTSAEVAITIVTPEDAPLAMFGTGVSQGVAGLLTERRIEVITSAYAEVPGAGVVEISPGNRSRNFDRVVALPQLQGPALPGVPEASDGFIAVDEHCQVRGLERVYAAGDATEFPVKYGGIAAQQADTAARAIAALAGAPVEPEPFDPLVHGVLLTGRAPLYLRAHITGGHGSSSELSQEPWSDSPAKIAAKYLAPYLDQRDQGA
jgi:sulfide:quinone oxidoreductase